MRNLLYTIYEDKNVYYQIIETKGNEIEEIENGCFSVADVEESFLRIYVNNKLIEIGQNHGLKKNSIVCDNSIRDHISAWNEQLSPKM